MASYQVGPEVLPGRVGAVPLTDHVDHGMAATLSWQGSHGNRRSVTASSWRADQRRYRTAPPQLRTKGNSGIIKGGCAERKLDAFIRHAMVTHFLSTTSRNVGPRKIQFVGISEIGPLMPKIAI